MGVLVEGAWRDGELPQETGAGGEFRRADSRFRDRITAENAPIVARAGANVLVAGSAVFKRGGPDAYRANIAAIRNAAALARGEAA